MPLLSGASSAHEATAVSTGYQRHQTLDLLALQRQRKQHAGADQFCYEVTGYQTKSIGDHGLRGHERR